MGKERVKVLKMVSIYEKQFKRGDLVKIVYKHEPQFWKKEFDVAAPLVTVIGWIRSFLPQPSISKHYLLFWKFPDCLTENFISEPITHNEKINQIISYIEYIDDQSIESIEHYNKEMECGLGIKERLEEIQQNPKYLTHENVFVRNLAKRGLKNG